MPPFLEKRESTVISYRERKNTAKYSMMESCLQGGRKRGLRTTRCGHLAMAESSLLGDNRPHAIPQGITQRNQCHPPLVLRPIISIFVSGSNVEETGRVTFIALSYPAWNWPRGDGRCETAAERCHGELPTVSCSIPERRNEVLCAVAHLSRRSEEEG